MSGGKRLQRIVMIDDDDIIQRLFATWTANKTSIYLSIYLPINHIWLKTQAVPRFPQRHNICRPKDSGHMGPIIENNLFLAQRENFPAAAQSLTLYSPYDVLHRQASALPPSDIYSISDIGIRGADRFLPFPFRLSPLKAIIKLGREKFFFVPKIPRHCLFSLESMMRTIRVIKRKLSAQTPPLSSWIYNASKHLGRLKVFVLCWINTVFSTV